ncbi:MAG TPA: hypothetical protein VGG01_00480 [Xanthobacteraceae bacterium]|jgi:hypothetical protein
MRTLLAATAASALLLIPVGAYAQRSPQTTEAQQNFRDSVKAQHPTAKRRHILRSETNKNETTGVAPMRRHYEH